MSRLIINADDFGYCSGVNRGIIESHQNGVLTSTTMMCGMPGFDEAVNLAIENPKLGVGVHLTLTSGYPVKKDLQTIVAEDGKFRSSTFYFKENGLEKIDYDEVRAEWQAQIEKLIDAGLRPSHLDSHHYMSALDGLREISVDLAYKYDVPLRYVPNLPDDIRAPKKIIDYFDVIGHKDPPMSAIATDTFIKDLAHYDLVETVCHPGYADDFLMANSSWNTMREITVRELTNPKYKKMFEENNIVLINFNNI